MDLNWNDSYSLGDLNIDKELTLRTKESKLLSISYENRLPRTLYRLLN